MRFICLLLITCLLPASSAHALELFGDFLYWKATEPVDWVLNTNDSSSDQFVEYETLQYDPSPGFRFGVACEEPWGARLYYTHHYSSTTATASGNLTGTFLGAKLAAPPAPDPYFDTGQAESSIDYNMIDLDFGTDFFLTERLTVRPIIGLRGGWIHQSFHTAFQADYPSPAPTVHKDFTETMKNNFWGLGPKIGIENSIHLARGETSQLNCVANLYIAYLWGQWSISDVSHSTIDDGTSIKHSTQYVNVDNRDFGSVAFQTMVGLNWQHNNFSATLGYELNDWLNQCQIFDDATGPHNNDLLLQGLTAELGLVY